MPIDRQMLLTGAPTAAAARIEAALQKTAQRKVTTVGSLPPPLNTNPGGEKRWDSVSIELTQANTQ